MSKIQEINVNQVLLTKARLSHYIRLCNKLAIDNTTSLRHTAL